MTIRTRRLAVTTLAAALGASALPASEAVAAPTRVSAGRTSLTLTAKTRKALKRHHVKVAARAGGSTRGRTYRLPVKGGKFDFGTNRGTLSQRGTLRLKLGRKSVVVSGLTLTLGRKSKVVAKVGGRKITLGVLLRGKQKVRSSSADRTLSGIRLRLTAAAAKRIDKRLGRKAVRGGEVLGNVTVQVRKPSSNTGTGSSGTPASEAKIGFSPAFTQALGQAELPASAVLGAQQLPDGSIDLPVAAANIDPSTGTGTVDLAGAIVLGSGANAVTIDHLGLEFGADSNGLYGNVNGIRVKVAAIEGTGLSEALQSGSKQLSGLLATLSPEAAAALNQAGGVSLFVPGTPFGDINVTLPGS
jgi:hypothetical protein